MRKYETGRNLRSSVGTLEGEEIRPVFCRSSWQSVRLQTRRVFGYKELRL